MVPPSPSHSVLMGVAPQYLCEGQFEIPGFSWELQVPVPLVGWVRRGTQVCAQGCVSAAGSAPGAAAEALPGATGSSPGTCRNTSGVELGQGVSPGHGSFGHKLNLLLEELSRFVSALEGTTQLGLGGREGKASEGNQY